MKFTKTLVAGLALSLSATAAFANTTIRYSNWLPATHPFMDQVIRPWIEEVSEVTEGRVTVEILPKVVGTVPTQFEVVRDGLADMTLIIDGYSAGRFNLNGIVELPFLGNDARAISIAYWRIYKKHLEKFAEYENTIPVAKVSVGPMSLATREGPIDSLDKMKGLKLRVSSSTLAKILSELGGVAVNKPVSEMYELISTGVVDGMISSNETLYSFKLADLIGSLLIVPGGLSGAGISFIINDEKLAEMSPEDQEAFWSVSGEVFSTKVGNIYRDLNQKGRQSVADAGGTVIEASDELTAELHTALASVDQVWIDKAKAAGLDNAEEVLAEFRAEIRKVEADLAAE